MGHGPIYADDYYLRYNILNSNPETYNWWIVLKGASFCDNKVPATCQSSTSLECFICNEGENCFSNAIPVPYRLNIINVANYIPVALFPASTYPKAGFTYCALVEAGYYLGESGYPESFTNENFTAFMWSYQRQQRFVKVPYPVDPKKLDKFDFKYGIISENELFSTIDPADRLRR
jgi:hypothetical protein